jgi:hypothetical protein
LKQEFPEWKDLYESIFKRFQEFVQKVESVHKMLFEIKDQHKLAKEAKKYPFYGVLFECKSIQNVNFYNYFSTYHFGKLYSLIKKTESKR